MTTTLRLSDSSTFTMTTEDPDKLAAIAVAILSHLGCSFQVSYPVRTDQDRIDRERDREYHRARRQEAADHHELAVERLGELFEDEEREIIREALRASFLAGWDAAPKPIGYLQ